MRNAISAVLALFVLACATQHRSMIGKPVDLAEQHWGVPTRSWPADGGRHVYVWKQLRFGSAWLVTLTTDAEGLVLEHEQVRSERAIREGAWETFDDFKDPAERSR